MYARREMKMSCKSSARSNLKSSFEHSVDVAARYMYAIENDLGNFEGRPPIRLRPKQITTMDLDRLKHTARSPNAQ